MTVQLYESLKTAEKKKALPEVIAYHRIDGPGSSLDLSEFQQAFWKLPRIPEQDSPAKKWTRNLPRTVGITIDTGTRVEAHPFDSDRIGIKSVEYETEIAALPGDIIPVKENWLLKILEIFDLSGVMFVLKNLKEGLQSSGLGGSSAAATGVCILANELAGRPFSKVQLISLASRIEQDFGVSITGTQEQSNVLFGGVTDYVWFPWGIPGHPDTGYGASLRFELINPRDYHHLENRMAIFHSGHPCLSTSVNRAWRNALSTKTGYKQHFKKMEAVYRFREGLRLQKWDHVMDSVEKYRKIRTKLCQDYMEGSMDLYETARSHNCTVFPLGAGGGGGILLFSPDPGSLERLRGDLHGIYREIPFKIRSKGYEINNTLMRGI